jgi:hypothetical protein
LYFSRTENISGSEHLDQSKGRRSPITTGLLKITEVKRKIKP